MQYKISTNTTITNLNTLYKYIIMNILSTEIVLH